MVTLPTVEEFKAKHSTEGMPIQAREDIHFEAFFMADGVGLRKTCFGVFFVLAMLGSLASLAPKIRCRGFCRTVVSISSRARH